MNKERIAEFLAQNIPASDVARIVGCTPAYISQLAKDSSFVALLTEKKQDYAEKATAETALDDRYSSMELKLLSRMESTMLSAELPAVTRALEVISKRRSEMLKARNPLPQTPATAIGSVNVANLIQVTLPSMAFERNGKNEIVEVDGQSMAPLPSNQVKELFSSLSSTSSLKGMQGKNKGKELEYAQQATAKRAIG